MKLVLSDELLRAILLEWISRTASTNEEGDVTENDPVVRALGMLTLAEVRTVAMRATGAVEVTINRNALLSALDDLARAKSRSSHLEFFLANGATREMLVEVLGVSQNRLDTLRKRLGRPAIGRGRPRMPDVVTRERIIDRWGQLSGQSAVERFVSLREEFPAWSLGSLAAVVNELASIPVPKDSAKAEFATARLSKQEGGV